MRRLILMCSILILPFTSSAQDCLLNPEYQAVLKETEKKFAEAYAICVASYKWTAYWHRYDQCVKNGDFEDSDTGCGPLAGETESEYKPMSFGVAICDSMKLGTESYQAVIENFVMNTGIEKCQ